MQDVPMHSPPTRQPFAQWIKFVDFPAFTPDAWWVAVDNGVPVGASSLWPSHKEPTLASTGLTGVRRLLQTTRFGDCTQTQNAALGV